jgi:heme-degrading monooxygenase HmoA
VTRAVTAVDAVVPADREQELLEGFRRLASTPPDGLLRTELLRGQEGRWRIQTTWRDRAAITALRASGQGPAAQQLLDSVGATHTHDFFTIEESSPDGWQPPG